MPKIKLGIRGKLFIYNITYAFIITLAISSYFLFYHYYKEISMLFEEKNKIYTNFWATKAWDAMLTDDIDTLKNIVKEVKNSLKDVEYCFFRTEDGKIIADTFDGKLPSQLKNIGKINIEKKAKMIVEDIKLYDKNIRNFSYPIAMYGTINIGFKKKGFFDIISKEIRDVGIFYLVSLILGLAFSWVFSNRIVKPLKELMEGIRALREGKVNVLVDVKTNDEIEEVAEIFNETIEKLQEYIQTEEERRRTQENVIKFLEVVSTAAEGDFTKRAPVTADAFGSIADAFNLMMDDLSALINDVKKTAKSVSDETTKLIEMFKQMSDGAETQMLQMKSATEAVDETMAATLEISSKTEEATKVSEKAEEAANTGGHLVNQSIEGMQLIRVTVQTLNKKMKMFSERVMEIGIISGLISELASRTNLLAMNASIEAARAGEAGKGFVVIAEEIRGLADKSAEASKEITSIIHAIQTEAGEITSSLEEETEIVERQSTLATETAEAFSKITSSVKMSKDKISEIYRLSERQRDLSNGMVMAVEQVNRISLEILKYIQQTTEISNRLAKASRRLFTSVDRFKLIEYNS